MTEQERPAIAKGPQPEGPGSLAEQLKAGPEIETKLPPDVQKMTGKPAIEAARSIEEQKPEEIEPPKKGEIGVTSDGQVGKILEVRNNAALIEDNNGKRHKVQVKDLSPEPQSVRNTKIIMDVSKVPEKLKSAMLSFVFVPKSKSDIILRMGTGKKAYRYWRKDGQPIDEAQVEKLREGSTIPITDGDEFLGSWNPKEADSRGSSAAREIVQNARRWSPEKEAKFEQEGLSKGTAYAAEVPMPKRKSTGPRKLIFLSFMAIDKFENEIDIAKEMFDREKAARLLSEGKRKRARKEKEIERRYI